MTSRFDPDTATRVRSFFRAPPTPLVSLSTTATEWGLGGVYIKDESKRMQQQSFKLMGATYAMARYMADEIGVPLQDCGGIDGLKDMYSKHSSGSLMTFVTCTDGNHGRAVSWAAKQLGQKAVVYMPKGSAAARVKNIVDNGGECTVTEMNYDDTVLFAAKQAAENGWILLQDTTMPGYTEVPALIMEGYTAMADEAIEQLQDMEGVLPTHIFLQVGVGSMAGAVLAYMVERFQREGLPTPVAITVEPNNAACAYESARKGDGSAVDVDGDLESMIAGLCCGVLSTIGWPILWDNVDGAYTKVSDAVAGNGMRLLNSPPGQDECVEAGECGGAPVGLLHGLMTCDFEQAAALRDGLGLDANSRVLIFNTEGATDPLNYKRQLDIPDVTLAPEDFEFVLRRMPFEAPKQSSGGYAVSMPCEASKSSKGGCEEDDVSTIADSSPSYSIQTSPECGPSTPPSTTVESIGELEIVISEDSVAAH